MTTSSDAPRVSVVIPVFNGSNYLGDAIDSALGQTWPNVEVIVVDDGSTDGGATARIARSYGDRIRLIELEHGGVSAALNAGIRAMTGDLFAWLSHDDVYAPRKLERQIEVLRAHDKGTIVYSDYELVGPDLARIKRKILPDVPPTGFRVWLMTDSALHGCTVLLPRSCFDDELFDERLMTTQDYDMWFRLARDHRFVRVPELLLKYRIHGAQESWTNPVRVDEGNRLLIGFLEAIGPDEIRAAGRDPSLAYLEAAVRYKLRGYAGAAARARELARRQAPSTGAWLAPRRIALAMAYPLADRRLTPMYWWKRAHFRGSPAAAPAVPAGSATGRLGLETPVDPVADP